MAETIEQMIMKIVNRNLKKSAPVVFRMATVESVDKNKDTCMLNMVNGDADRIDVLLRAVIDTSGIGRVDYPAINSQVIVGCVDNNLNYSFILLMQQVESFKIVIDNSKITADKDLYTAAWKKWQFNDGSYGGLVKLIDPNNSEAGVLARLNKLENALTQHIALFNSHTHICSAPGSASAVPIPVDTQAIIPTQKSDLEDTNVTH